MNTWFRTIQKNLNKKTSTIMMIIFGCIVVLGICIVPADHIAFAQNATDTLGIAEFEQNTVLGGADLRTVIARIINVFLGLLGVIAVGIMLYAGFLWMTAGGNSEQVDQAKRMIGQAVIGLVIIVASWSIVTFVLNRLTDATGTGQNDEQQIDPENNCLGAACEPNGGGNPEDQCLADQNFFVVKSLSPNTSPEQNAKTGHNNIVVRAVFNQPVNEAIAAADVIELSRDNIPVEVAQARYASGRRVVELFIHEPQAECIIGNGAQTSCLNLANYQFEVNANTRSQNGTLLSEENGCGNFPREATFQNDVDVLDVLDPEIEEIKINGKSLQEVGQNGLVLERGKRSEIFTTISDRKNNQGGIGYVELILQNEENANDRVVYAG